MTTSKTGKRTLVLMRHAKSDWPLGVPDHERPLAERGQRDAPAAGRWLADRLGILDLAVISTATRTQQTWALARPLVECSASVDEPRVYDASARELLHLVEALSDEVSSAIFIGHNPGMEELAMRLSGNADTDAAAQLRQKFPTSAIAIIEISGAWADATTQCRLVEMVVPRG